MDAITLWKKARELRASKNKVPEPVVDEAIKMYLCRIDALDGDIGYLRKVQRGGYYRLLLFRLDYAFHKREWQSILSGPSTKLLISEALKVFTEKRRILLTALGRQLWESPSSTDLRIIDDVSQPNDDDNSLLIILARPSVVSKFIIPGAFILMSLGAATRLMWRINWAEVYSLTFDLLKASQHLLNDWIITPLVEIWKTIRYRSSNLALVSAAALKADMDSLERMVTNFARKHYPQVPEAEVISQVRSGDVTLMLRRYEAELQAPLKNVVLGDIVSMLLIQVQKSKVDLEGAMMAMDRLLKANELNFELLAVIPLMALLYYGFALGKKQLLRVLNKSERHTIARLKVTVRQVEYLLNDQGDHDPDLLLGELFIVVKKLLIFWQAMPSNWRRKYDEHVYQDLSELLSMRVASAKLPTIARMYHYYPFLQSSA